MSVVGVGVLQAALEAQGAPALVLSGKHALALTSAARDILTEFFDYPPAPAAPPLSQPVLDFAAVVLDAKGASLTTEVSASEGRKMKMTGAAHTDAATGQSLVILTLEKVLRRWDMFMDPKHWHRLLTEDWPYQFYVGERRDTAEEHDLLIFALNNTSARTLGLSDASKLVPGTSHIKLGYGWSQADSFAWAEEVRRQGGTSYSLERDTKRGIIRSSGIVCHAPDGSNRFRIIGTGEDVTEARRSVRQVQIWKALFEKAPLGMGVASIIDNDTDVMFETVNPLIASMLEAEAGVKPLEGYRGSQLKHRQQFERFLAQAIQCRDLGKPIDLEYTTTDPTLVHWQVHYVPLGGARFGWIAQNVTAKKELELMLRKEGEQLERAVKERTRDLEAALQVKRRFLAVVSHELRTPIAGILGSMDLLEGSVQLNDDQSSLLNIVRTCGEQLSSLIDDILDFTKLQEKKVVLQAAEFSLRELLENAIEIAAFSLRGKCLELLLEPLSDEIPDRVVADPSRLRQIILNLLNNAVKFTERGEVSVAVSGAGLSEGGTTCTLSLAVRDTGIGIPPHMREKLFQPFSQGDSSVSRQYGGSGLGLSIAKHLAQLMGGDLTFQSAGIAGAGTVFTLSLPVLVERRFEPAPALAQGRRVQVVLVEEQHSLRRVLHAHLCQALGHADVAQYASVAEAAAATWTSGVGAKRSLDAPGAALLVADQRHASALAELSRRAAVQVLYGYSRDDAACGDERHTVYLKKPVRASALRTALAVALRLGSEHTPVATVSPTAATPQPAAKRALVSTEKVKHGSGSTLRILVAEDNLSNQIILRRYLELLGYPDFKIVENGVEAVREATTSDYDLILMDVMMPIMSGVEASEEIVRIVPARRRPHIVAVTASAFEEDKQRCLAAGMQAVLTKPVDRRKLEGLLSERARALGK